MFFTMFVPGMSVSYADGGASTPQAGNEETLLVTPQQSSDVDQAEVNDRSETTDTGISEPTGELDTAKEIGIEAGAETDTEAPSITVVGLVDKQEVSQSELTFNVTVTDNVYKDIIPEVKLNDEVVLPETVGKYKVSLKDGGNLIEVLAKNGAGKPAEKSFSIKYSKVVPPLSAKEQLDKNLAYILRTVSEPNYGTGNGEWSVLSLARADYKVEAGYYDSYYEKVKLKVKELMLKNNGQLDTKLSTEESRVILGLTSIGKDVHNVAGYDITKSLAKFDYVKAQGINGSIFALIALDSHNYEIPLVEGGDPEKQTTRQKLIDYILAHESKNGSWGFIDTNAMALQSLAPYYSDIPEVKIAVDRTIESFSKSQLNDGSIAKNIFSSAQVILALTSLGINPDTDSRFIKNGKSALDGLLMFANPEGGFKLSVTGKVNNNMATDQGTYALVSYDRLVNNKNRLFDMKDVQIKEPSQPELPHAIELPLPAGNQPVVDISDDKNDYIIPITQSDSNKDIQISILGDRLAKVSVNLPFKSSLPNIEVTKGTISLSIPKGAKITNGDSSSIELLTSKSVADTALIDTLSSIIPVGQKLDHILQAFTVGGSGKVEFNQFVTLTLTAMKGKDAAYIENESPHAIQKYASDIEGKASGKNEYAYDSGNDLIVKTNHFTDYVAYTSSTEVIPPVITGKYVTLSVDKLMINKGYVVSNMKVELRSGDTAWTILRRVLDSKGISYSWNNKYGTPYLESIAGDGEFDHGSGSGWMYNVNGSYPGYGASQYVLSDGDEIQWRYTASLGEDLGERVPTGSLISMGEGMIINSNDKTPVINVPSNIQKDYNLSIPKELQNTNNITINIPDVKAKVFLSLEDVKDNIPMITVNKGNITVVIDKGTRFKSGDRKIELMTSNQDTKLQEIIQSTLSKGDKVTALNYAFMMGNTNSSVLFDKPLSITIKGAKGQMIGFIENNKFTPITMYGSEDQGLKETQGSEKRTYGYVKGNDIFIKTNHFTTFVSYTVGLDATVPTKPSTGPNLNNVYSDVSAISNWAYDAILEATNNRYIQGSNGKFHPKANITRAEFTKILVNVLALDTKLATGANFKDVRVNDWFYPYVNAANKAGLVTGYNDEFHPNDNITREQMAVTIVRALSIQPMKSGTAIKDIHKASAWAKTDIETVTALGLMTGSDNLFNPKDAVTREMAAVVSTRIHKYKNDHKTTDTNTGKVDSVDSTTKLEVQTQIKDTAAFMQKAVTDPIIASVGGDWTVFGLARSDVPVPDAYYAKYYANVEKILKEKSGKLHNVKYTEYDRVILALTAMGRNIDDVAGYNLREPLADFDTLIKQGINGPIFALIALDSMHYEIPIVAGVKTQTTRELLINFILNREISGGGWALGEKPDVSDADVTSMAIQGLVPYYATNSKVKAAVDRGVAWLSKAQMADGGYTSGRSVNSESIAQVVVALSSLGIDADRDTRFIKNGKSPLDALLSFAAPSGGFYHIKSGGQDNGGAKPGGIDLMATDQVMYALVAYDRYINKQTRLYDMSDVK